MDKRLIVKPVSIGINIYCLVQELIWTCFALVCILYRFEVFSVDNRGFVMKGDLKWSWLLFLTDENDRSYRNINSIEFLIFLIIYLCSSFVIVGLSSYIIQTLITSNDKWGKGMTYMHGSTGALMIATSIVDIILYSLILVDRTYLKDLPNFDQIATSSNILSAYLFTANMVIRGYAVWVINIVVGALLIRFAVVIKRNANKTPPGSLISVYDSKSPPDGWMDVGRDNPNFIDLEGVPHPSQEDGGPSSLRNYYLNPETDLPNRIYDNQMYDDDYPYIPTPDYTPPASPPPNSRPILKTNGRYAPSDSIFD